MSHISRDLFKAIHEGKWLSIEYQNQKKELTRYWIAVQSIDPRRRTIQASGFHVYQHTVMRLDYIRIDAIVSSSVIEGSWCEINQELVEAIDRYPERYETIFGTTANLKVLNYLVDCSRLDTELLIANVITEEADLDKITMPDLIICTVPVNRPLVTPFVQVQPFLMESDVTAIRQKIDEIRTSKKREKFTAYLRQIILPDFFERGEGFGNREEAIHYLCEKFRQKGYVGEAFEEEVLEREEMSSTGFQNFAIPHSMRMRANKTGMYLYLCDTPTDWNDMPVSLIILLCFNRDERYIFNEIFEPLTMILTEPNNLKKALTLNEYEEFIEFLSDCL